MRFFFQIPAIFHSIRNVHMYGVRDTYYELRVLLNLYAGWLNSDIPEIWMSFDFAWVISLKCMLE